MIILLISITIWPFNGYQTLLILWLKISYKSGYLYIWKKIKIKKKLNIHTFFNFGLESCRLFKNNFCLKYLPSIASYYSQNILSFTKFSGKRKYYRELISYEQCRLARIISKGGWAVVSWGQRAETICLTTSDIP